MYSSFTLEKWTADVWAIVHNIARCRLIDQLKIFAGSIAGPVVGVRLVVVAGYREGRWKPQVFATGVLCVCVIVCESLAASGHFV